MLKTILGFALGLYGAAFLVAVNRGRPEGPAPPSFDLAGMPCSPTLH